LESENEVKINIDYAVAAMAVNVEGALATRPVAGSIRGMPLANILPEDSRINESGHLEVGGCDVVDVVREFGTPAFIFAEEDIRARARDYVDAFARHTDAFEVLFASKALACTAAYQLLGEEGLSVDVASGGELFMALKAGIQPDRIYFHGNNKAEAEIRMALDAGVEFFVVDSFDEIALLDSLLERPQKVLVRVTPDVKPETHEAAQTGQTDSKFGFGLASGQARKAMEAVRESRNLQLDGLHAHIGSQILSLEVFLSEIDALATIADSSLRLLNLGGGLGIPYVTGERLPPSIEEYIEAIVNQVKLRFDPVPRILVEPGRSLVGNAGITAYQIGTMKEIPGVRTYVAVNGGMSDNLRPMLYGSEYEALIANRPEAEADTIVTVVGKHCETGDNLIKHAKLASPRIGDVLVVPSTGAYGHSMANNYNGVPRPPVIFCKHGDARAVVRRETYEDLVARDC
jgi:diaminopimelate decarboxylase